MNEDFSQMIGKIMANPEFGNLVNQLKSSGLTDGKNEEAVPAAVVQDTGNPTPPAADEIAQKLPELMSLIGQSGEIAQSADAAKIQKALGTLRKLDNRNCEKLLAALKPYLNSQRGEVIDKAMSMMKLTDLLGVIGQTNGK